MLFLKQFGTLDWFMVVAWGVIFLVTLFIELETMDLITIWFCISALVTCVFGIMFLAPIWQCVMFVGLSFALIIITQPLAKKRMKTGIIKTNTDRLVGEIGIVTKEIVPNEIGEIKVENQLWRAINNEGLSFTVGEEVMIDAISGIKLVVSKVDGDGNVEIIKK